jgi:solute carrier family 35, member E3
VGFYQLMKVLTTPVVVVLQNVMYGVDLPAQLKLALVPVCLGVALATVNDFSFNPVRRPVPYSPAPAPCVAGRSSPSAADHHDHHYHLHPTNFLTMQCMQAGAFWATAGLLATAFYQLLVKTRQDKLGVNSFQLLHYQAPQSAFFVLACTPLFDKVTGPGGFMEVGHSL